MQRILGFRLILGFLLGFAFQLLLPGFLRALPVALIP